MAELKPCPVCRANATLNRDVICGSFFMGWSVGCPRYCVGDGIHGVNSHDVDESQHYRLFGFFSKEEAIKAWNRRCTPEEIDFDYGAEDE